MKAILTARSVCAALGILELWKYVAGLDRITVTVLSQEPASSIFNAHHVPHHQVEAPVILSSGDSSDAEILLDAVASLLVRFQPDVILVGLSTPGEGGVDEAALYHAKCPTFMLQDFWGDTNLFFGRHPDCYLVQDEYATKRTKERHSWSSEVVGSPRHACYAEMNFTAIHREMRIRLGCPPDDVLHGFFCQPLDHVDGYIDSIAHWAEAVRATGERKVLYRPHPSSVQEQRERILSLLADFDLVVYLDDQLKVEQIIAACTSVTSTLSNSMLDAVYVNRFSPRLMALPIYMASHPNLIEAMSVFYDFDRLPAVEQGFALCAKNSEQAAMALAQAADRVKRDRFWHSTQSLPSPLGALKKTWDILLHPHNCHHGPI